MLLRCFNYTLTVSLFVHAVINQFEILFIYLFFSALRNISALVSICGPGGDLRRPIAGIYYSLLLLE